MSAQCIDAMKRTQSKPALSQAPDAPALPLLEASRLAAEAGNDLALELLIDHVSIAQGEELTIEVLVQKAVRAGHFAGIVQQHLATRVCLRCDAPLYSRDGRMSGYCDPCREDIRAALAIACAAAAEGGGL